jgi:hypothetical protein
LSFTFRLVRPGSSKMAALITIRHLPFILFMNSD